MTAEGVWALGFGDWGPTAQLPTDHFLLPDPEPPIPGTYGFSRHHHR